jgi:hypothetical protein
VFTIFIPDQTAQLFLAHHPHINAESTLSEERDMANHDVFLPLPVEMEEFAQLKGHITRIKDELIGGESSSLYHMAMASTEAASKIKQLGADTAKKVGALVTGGTKATSGGGTAAPPPPPAPAPEPVPAVAPR